MPDKPPTYRERAIATDVNNHSGLRDLIIDIADEIDKIKDILDSLASTQSDETETNIESEIQ